MAISLQALNQSLAKNNAATAAYNAQAPKAAPKAAPRAAPPPPGPTNFWARIATAGVGKVNAYNAYATLVEHHKAVQSNNKPLKSAAIGLGKSMVAAPVGLAKDVNKQLISPAAHQAGELVTHPGQAFQQAAQVNKQKVAYNQAVKAGKLSTGTAKLTQALNAQADVGKLLSQGQNEKQIQKYLIQKNNGQNKTANRIAAELVGTAALFVGGAETKGAATGLKAGAKAFAKSNLKTAAATGTANVAGTLQQNPNAKPKELVKAGVEGVAAGSLLHGAGKVGGTVVRKTAQTVSPRYVRKGINKEAVTNVKTNALVTKAQGKSIQVTDQSKPSGVLVKKPNATKLLGPGGTKATGKGFTMGATADQNAIARGAEINRLQKRVTAFQQGKLNMSPEQAKSEQLRLQELKTGKPSPTLVAQRAHEATIQNGGVTISTEGKMPNKGYSYSPYKGRETVIPTAEFHSPFGTARLKQFQKDNADLLSLPGHHVGTWSNPEDGKTYLDIVKVGAAHPDTIKAAQESKQLAVYDLQHNKEITTGHIDQNGVYSRHDSPSSIYNQHQREVAGSSNTGSPGSSQEVSQDLQPRSSQATEARPQEASITGKLTRPSAPKEEPKPLVDTNKPVKSIVAKFTPKRLSGKLNPVDAAARQGHTDFANATRDVVGRKIYALRRGNIVANEFDKAYAKYLAGGGTHQQFIKDIEAGRTSTEAHKLWVQIHQDTGQALQAHGNIKAPRNETYVPRVGQFPNKPNTGQATVGLSKGGGFTKARTQAQVDEFGNSSDLFKTHADYKAHVESFGGKVLTDPRDILRHTLPAKMEAIENAKGLAKLDRTAMADGRPATVTFDQSKGLPHEYSDYNQRLLPGRAVHPDATNTVNAMTHTYTYDELHNPIARTNSVAKQLVTLNGLVHGKNFGLASMRKQGIIHTATALVKSNRDLASTFGEENIKRAITKGGLVPFEQAKQDLFDNIKTTDGPLKARGKAWSAVTAPFRVVHNKVNDALFNKVGNHLQFSTYFNIEKQMIKKGLNPDEAARIAGAAAKNVSFISSPIETSVEYRKGARIIFFAGQYFKSTMNEAARAVGVSQDKSLSSAAQRAAQKDAIKGLARGFTYLFALAQGINYATTGHSTLENKDSKISPVVYVDKKTGKEYHVTNWFGQIGDILHITNPQEWLNKTSPALHEVGQVISNKDFFGNPVRDTTASGARQTVQILANAVENMAAPLGVSYSDANKLTGKGGQPGVPTGLRFLGYGTSTKDQTPMEKDINKRYTASLPAQMKFNQSLSTDKAIAANDLKQGKTNSPALQKLKGEVTPTQYKTFLKTGKLNEATVQFNKLSPANKMQILQKYSSTDIKSLDLKTFMTDLAYKKATVDSLHQAGYTDQQIEAVIQKSGFNNSQLYQLRAEAKKQASIQARAAAHRPHYSSVFTQ